MLDRLSQICGVWIASSEFKRNLPIDILKKYCRDDLKITKKKKAPINFVDICRLAIIKRPQVIETRAISEFELIIFELKRMILLNCDDS